MRFAAFTFALLFSSVATALDYRSVSGTAILYDAPSQKAKRLFVIAAGTPVELIVTLAAWVKVRDAKGDLAWIEQSQLAEQRTVQVRSQGAQVRGDASDAAKLVFEAEADVVLELVEPAQPAAPGWIKVRHRDGQQGFVKVSQVWGL